MPRVNSLVLLLFPVPAPLPSPGRHAVHPPHVLPDAVRGGKAGRADGAGEGLLPRVLPLVPAQCLFHRLIIIIINEFIVLIPQIVSIN